MSPGRTWLRWVLLAVVGIALLIAGVLTIVFQRPASSERAPPIPEIVSLRLQQRSEVGVPHEHPVVLVSVGDVTGGRVPVRVRSSDGRELAAPSTLAPQGSLAFDLQGVRHRLVVLELENNLFGEDFVSIEIRRADDPSPSPASADSVAAERRRIEALIEGVAALEGVQFIRNGTTHTPAEAADHMRRKWQAGGDRIRTAEQFIEHCASASSVSGEAYLLRWPDGRETTSRAYLKELLRGFDHDR